MRCSPGSNSCLPCLVHWLKKVTKRARRQCTAAVEEDNPIVSEQRGIDEGTSVSSKRQHPPTSLLADGFGARIAATAQRIKPLPESCRRISRRQIDDAPSEKSAVEGKCAAVRQPASALKTTTIWSPPVALGASMTLPALMPNAEATCLAVCSSEALG